MGITVVKKVQIALQRKEEIRQAIVSKGVRVGELEPLRVYPERIRKIGMDCGHEFMSISASISKLPESLINLYSGYTQPIAITNVFIVPNTDLINQITIYGGIEVLVIV